MSDHLITSLGVPGNGGYPETVYELNGARYATRFSAVAAARAHKLAGARASVLVTDRAREHFEELAKELRAAGVAEVTAVAIPDGRTTAEVEQVVRTTVALLRPGDAVIADITMGLRHVPLTLFAALGFAAAKDGVSIAALYYGAREAARKDADGLAVAPLVDLRRLVDLVRWSHALEATRTRGDLLATAGLLRKEVADQYRAGEGEPALSKVKDYAEDLSRSLPAGLPLEVGLAARQLIDAEARLAAQGASLPHQAARALAGQIQKLATPPGIKTKADVRLDAIELRRQLDLSRWYLARHNLPAAALLLREWTVSWAVLDAGQEDLWLDSDTRYAAERSLGASALRSREKRGSEEEQQVGRLWNEITGPRNALAHAGMAGDNFDKRPEDLIRLPDDFAGLLARPPGVLGRRQIPRLLLTPLGNSRGVLYSALKRTTPKFVVVVTTSEARLSLHEAAGHAGVALVGAGEEAAGRIPHIVVELRDPHGGIAELPAVLRDKALCDVLAEATMVEMNITGGTTLMQALVERLAKYAARRGAVVRPFVLPDRRTLEEQRASPFVAAERVDLDLSGSAE